MELIRIIGALPADFETLAPSASTEGIETVGRVRDEWASGLNRFDKAGEALLAVRIDGTLAGIGGITRDDHVPDALRMRRFYIDPQFRGHGAGKLLASRLLHHARPHTKWITLRAGSDNAARFWEHLGFAPVVLETHTHELRF